MNNDEVLAQMLDEILREEMSECDKLPCHKFSGRFERRMHRLCKMKQRHSFRMVPARRLAGALSCAFCALVLVLGATHKNYVIWNNFELYYDGDVTQMTMKQLDGCPETLEKHYTLSGGLRGYKETVLVDTDTLRLIEYYNEETDNKITFFQQVKGDVSMPISSADLKDADKFVVDNHAAMGYKNETGEYTCMWDDGDYLLGIEKSNMTKNTSDVFTKYVHLAEF